MIIKCKECGGEMSSNARECPKCGRYRHFTPNGIFWALVAWLAFIAWLSWMFFKK